MDMQNCYRGSIEWLDVQTSSKFDIELLCQWLNCYAFENSMLQHDLFCCRFDKLKSQRDAQNKNTDKILVCQEFQDLNLEH